MSDISDTDDFRDVLNSSPIQSPFISPSLLPGESQQEDTSPQPAAGSLHDSVGQTQTIDGLGFDASQANAAAIAALTQAYSATTDYTQIAAGYGHRMALNDTGKTLLTEFSQIPDARQQMMMVYSTQLQLFQKINLLRPSEEAFTISTNLAAHIDANTTRIFLDSQLGAYITDQWPKRKVVRRLSDHPEWGLTATIAADRVAMKAIGKRIGSRLTHHRNDTKETVGNSLGQFNTETKTFEGEAVGIIDLCEQVIREVGGRNYELQVDAAFCARIALIRKVYVSTTKASTNPGKAPKDFWKEVDAALEKIRDEKNGDQVKISKVMTKILDNDCKKYGQIPAVAISSLPLPRATTADV
ncbi:hypothetical protein VNI00_016418 [Paramarasmius palmivorus]|uniref:Uncharacterized protein n=1 Tax=Paramarasmius palmivorus TaxID=297713 RepID=A0AAW0BDL9_9AGAR